MVPSVDISSRGVGISPTPTAIYQDFFEVVGLAKNDRFYGKDPILSLGCKRINRLEGRYG
jgi:hypothetical protein